MSTTTYKVPYTDNFGSYGTQRKRYLYVREHNTSDSTAIYDDEGAEVYSYHADNEEEAKTLAMIIQGTVVDKEAWDGRFEGKEE